MTLGKILLKLLLILIIVLIGGYFIYVGGLII